MRRLRTSVAGPFRRTVASAIRELALIPIEYRSHRPRPPAKGLVLEVGGGQRPHPRADVVVDKYVVDDFERPGNAPLNVSRPLVVADGHALPFADRSMAYVIASQVLEHAADPARFAAELARVAEEGYVEVPTREAELTFEWPYHPWLVDWDGETLVFTEKDAHAPCGRLFHEAFAESLWFRLWWAAHRSRWLYPVHWRTRLDVRVTGSPRAEQATFDQEQTIAALELLADRGALVSPPGVVWDLLRCPGCRGRLRRSGPSLECGACGRKYAVAGGVPILVIGDGDLPAAGGHPLPYVTKRE